MTYPATGTYTDAIFDPGLQPTGGGFVSTIALPTAQQGVTATLLKADGSAAWDPTDATATGRQARVQLTLTTTDTALHAVRLRLPGPVGQHVSQLEEHGPRW